MKQYRSILFTRQLFKKVQTTWNANLDEMDKFPEMQFTKDEPRENRKYKSFILIKEIESET